MIFTSGYNVIKSALEFLQLEEGSDLANEVRDTIIVMLVKVDEATWDKRDNSKQIKTALKAHRLAIARVKHTRRRLLEVAGKEQAYLPFLALLEGEAKATRTNILISGFFQNKILDDSFDRKINNELESITELESHCGGVAATRRDVYARAAAVTAAKLLLLCGLPAKATNLIGAGSPPFSIASRRRTSINLSARSKPG
jgi:hypothetical protein